MSLNVVRQAIEVERLIGEDRSQLLTRADAAVPGAGRDAVEILLEDARVTFENIEVQADRVVVGGQIACQAVYRIGDQAQVFSLSAAAPFEHIAEIPGAGPRMTARVEGDVEHVEAQYESGRMIFFVTILPKVRVVSLDTVEAIGALEGIDGIEQSMIMLQSAKLNAEASAPVLLRDEVNLPAALNAEAALMYWATPRIRGVTRDLGGARVAGDITVEALILSGVARRPVALARDLLEFDQLVEFPDWLSGDVDAQADVRGLNVSVEPGGENDSLLRIHCDMDIGVRVSGVDTMEVMEDAYATGNVGIAVSTEQITLCDGFVQMSGQDIHKSVIMLPEDAPAAGTPLAVRVWPSVSEWVAGEDTTTIHGVLEIAVLYMPGGSDRLSSVRTETPFALTGTGALDADGWLRVTASEAEAATLMSDRLELKCILKASGMARMTKTVHIATDAEEAVAPARRKGVTVSYPGERDTVWTVGKRYALPRAAIAKFLGESEQLVTGRPLILRG